MRDGGTSSDGALLIRGGTLRIAAFFCMTILSVVYTFALTRALGVSKFGYYTTAISIATMVLTVTDQGMASYATREYAVLEGDERRALMSSIFGLRIALTVLGLGGALIFGLAAGYTTALLLGMLAASFATVPLIVTHTYSIPLNNALRLGSMAGLELTRQTIWTVAILVLCWVHAGLLPLLAALLFANVAMILPTRAVTRNMERIRFRLKPSTWRPLLAATGVFSLATAVGTVYLYLTQIITSLIASHTESGIFSVSFRVFIVTAGIPTLVGGSALPLLSRAARDDRERLAHVVSRFIEVSLAAGIGLALVLCASAHLVVPLLAGSQFKQAAPVLEIQAFAMIATFTAAPCSFGLLALHRYRQVLLANGTAFIVAAVATVILAGAYGAHGAAFATICGEGTVATAMLAGLLSEHAGYGPRRNRLLRLAVAALVTIPIVMLPEIPVAARTAGTLIAYPLLVVLLGALPEELNVRLSPLTRRFRHAL